MLGMGDDGHTASLFPESVSLLEQERWVIAPPDVVQGMSRLTLTLPALNAARRTVFLVSGAAKAPALARIRAGERLPAGLVEGAHWLVDEAAWRPGSDFSLTPFRYAQCLRHHGRGQAKA